jgi:hypothetical protein
MQGGMEFDLVAQDELGAWCQAALRIPMSRALTALGMLLWRVRAGVVDGVRWRRRRADGVAGLQAGAGTAR